MYNPVKRLILSFYVQNCRMNGWSVSMYFTLWLNANVVCQYVTACGLPIPLLSLAYPLLFHSTLLLYFYRPFQTVSTVFYLKPSTPNPNRSVHVLSTNSAIIIHRYFVMDHKMGERRMGKGNSAYKTGWIGGDEQGGGTKYGQNK